jgi:4-hydroxythreonine-4-phosphate dehydrogenase
MRRGDPPAGGPPLALTMGEPAGIGGEIALKAWMRRREGVPPFFCVDDPRRLNALAARLGWHAPVRPIAAPEEAAAVFARALPVVALDLSPAPVPGRPVAAHGPAIQASIRQAVGFAAGGRAAAVVTNPIHKKALRDSGFGFPGHTEFLAALAGNADPPVMMMASRILRVVPVTVHVSLRDALAALSADVIVHAASVAERALRTDFCIARPRLAVAGLNPHAGEDGEMGTEDRDIVAVAVATLRGRNLDVTGPHSPDALFTSRARGSYDAAVCMYHDQALIPLKALDFHGGVNVTLGLPFVRTSPDHGTAFDIAGTGAAEPNSLIAALRLAAEIASRRASAPTG